jgi:phosphatidylglycerol:prolipoprotein diacylglycerol transferase
MLALSFLIGIYWAMSRAEKRGIEKNRVMDLSLIIVICAIVGSRLLYVITHLDEFRGRWLDTFSPFQSSGEIGLLGLTMLGGVLLALAAILIYCKIKKLSVLKLSDSMAPAFALGIFLTRIGCFLHGCCFGKACDLPWAVTFPLISPAGSILPGQHLHPTQLYSSLYGLVILIVILLLDRKPRFDGFLLSVFFMLYGLFRFSVDFLRYYESSVKVSFGGISLTINQLISLAMFGCGLTLFIILRKRYGGAN